MTHAIAGAALVLYILACGLFSRERTASATILSVVGVALHLLSLALGVRAGSFNYDLGHTLSVLAMFSASAFLLFGRKRLKALSGAMMLLIVVLYALSAVIIHLDEEARQIPHWSGVLLVHIASTMAGMICFLFCSFFSSAVVFQDRALKTKQSLTLLSKMPPLRYLSGLSRQFLVAGVWATTIGLWFGFLYAVDAKLQIPLRDPKLIWSAVMLLYFGILLSARTGGRVTEIKFARYCSLGVLLIAIALFSATGSSFHNY